MSEFVAALKAGVHDARSAAAEAERTGDQYEADLQRARLRDLLAIAARTAVDTTGWDPASG